MNTDFHEVVFPLALSMQARGGPQRHTNIVTTGAGRENRISRWAYSRYHYDIGSGIKTRADLALLLSFFEERRGAFYGFRFRDPLDHASAEPDMAVTPFDQPIGQGDGTRLAFQLVKTYGAAFAPYARPIFKPVAGTLRLAVAGVEVALGQNADCDPRTGLVRFRSGHCPAPGQTVTAGFEFDVPVRFADDRLEAALDAFGSGEITKISLIELLCQPEKA
jgi:uncharacterized protein (TIGR02217 family)